jgi:hypothetical protein
MTASVTKYQSAVIVPRIVRVVAGVYLQSTLNRRRRARACHLAGR